MTFIGDFFDGVQRLNISLAQEDLRDVQRLLAVLASTDGLRLFVPSASGMGHQGSCVIVLDRLIALGYNGTIDVVYELAAGPALETLLPGFRSGKTDTMPYRTATLTFGVFTPQAAPKVAKRLGITGGMDTDRATEPPTTKLNVGAFLQLQPFGWEVKSKGEAWNQLWIGTQSIRLNSVESLGRQHFDNLAYVMADPALSASDWSAIAAVTADPDNLDKARALIAWVGSVQPAPYFLPAYGLLRAPGARPPPFSFSSAILPGLLAGALRRLQAGGRDAARPAVVAIIGSPKDSLVADFQAACAFVYTGLAAGKTVLELVEVERDDELMPSTRRELYQAIASVYPHSIGFAIKDNAAALQVKLAALQPDQILFVQLAPVSPLVFNLMLATATLPFIFEGQGTANLALNLGKPFFKMASERRNQLADVVYSLPMMPEVRDAVWTDVGRAIIDLCGVTFASVAGATTTIASVWARATGPDQEDPIQLYFAALRAFYHAPEYDKVTLGLRFTMQQVALVGQPLALQAAVVTDDDSPLPALYQALLANLSGTSLDLAPGAIPSGPSPIAQALAGLFGGGVSITGAAIAFPPPQTAIAITGTTTLGLVPLATHATFTIDPDVPGGATLVLGLALTAPSLTFDGAPWLALTTPTVAVNVSDGGLRNVGSFTAGLTVGTSQLTVTADLPTATTLSVAIDFTVAPPSIASVFQLLGGIDLTASLPAPLDALAGLSLEDASFAYDLATQQLVAFTVDLVTRPQWHLFGNLTLDTLGFSFTVADPVGARTVSWVASSEFMIGLGTLAVSVSYPNLTITALLADDSSPIALAELVSFFLGGAIAVPISGDLTDFNLAVTPGAGAAATTYSVDVTVAGDWPVPTAALTVFTVEQLGFAIAGTGSAATGSITGTIGFFAANPAIAFALTVRAAYQGPTAGWVISGTQGTQPILVSQILTTYLGSNWFSDLLPDFTLTDFAAEVHPGGTDGLSYFTLGGALSLTLPFGGLALAARGTFGKAMGASAPPGYPFAQLAATTTWNGITLDFGFDYAPGTQSYTVQWRSVIGAIAQVTMPDHTQHWVASLHFADGFTLGSMVETFVSWVTGYAYGLAAPWNLLDDINLSGLALTYDFTAGTVGFEVAIGPIDLVFARITTIGLRYDSAAPAGTPKLKLVLEGSFPWADDPKQLSWDPTDPSSTQAPPGNGSKYLDLRLLALGQRVRVPDIAKAATVQQAIAKLAALPPPSGHQLPAVTYAPDASWLIGTDFGLLRYDDAKQLYAVTLQIVFADPDLYGLRIALAGPPAKILGGLDFQILYRKISDTVGVYQAELALPAALRTIQAGIYTIQLPVIAAAIYTNGDFLIDIGFPWKADFTRSFTVQAIIYPGIPLLGSGGFYFGKLSSATTDKVPAVTNGTFQPVIVFGFGAQVGFGKSVTIGPLSAGFSLTVLGIIEGVIARWNPYADDQHGTTTPSQLDGTYFYSLSGTFGIAGTLNGQVDFAIVKAKVNIVLRVTAQITFTSYAPIVFTVQATVDVSAELEIDLGLFSITIRFHFSLSLRQSFTINPWTNASPPWQLASAPPPGRLGAPLEARLSSLRHARGLRAAPVAPVWTHLTAPTTKLPLTGYQSYALTAAGDAATALADQLTCYVAALAIDAPVPATVGAPHVAAADTSFDRLAKLVARWVIAAFQPGPKTSAAVDALVISDDVLAAIAAFLADDQIDPQPVPGAAFDAMLAQQVAMTLWGPRDIAPGTAIAGAFFPMPPALRLTVAAYGDAPALGYRFADYNTLSAAGVANLRTYFDQLEVQVQAESPTARLGGVTDLGASVASFVFTDYALFLARQMIAALQAGLRDLHHTPTAGQQPDDVVAWVVTTGAMGPGTYTRADLFAANPDAPLRAGAALTIRGAITTVGPGDSFGAIAARPQYGGGFTATALALANASSDRVLAPGASITLGGVTAPVDRGDSLTTMAGKLGVAVAAVVADAGVLADRTLVMTFAALAVPDFSAAVAATLAETAAAQGVTVVALAVPDGNGAIADLFWDGGAPARLDLPHLPKFPVGVLLGEVQATGQIAQLAAIVSRYHLHGLRLPTTDVTPNTLGMWVEQVGKQLTLPPDAGLYALTGQQFPIPPLSATPLALAIGLDGGPPWIAAKNGTATVPFSVSAAAGDQAGAAIVALRSWITTTCLATGARVLGDGGALRRTAACFGLGTRTAWIAPTPPNLPYGAPLPGATTAQLWRFPDALAALLDHSTHAVSPTFTPQTQTYDEATGVTTTAPIVNYGWATTVAVTVTQVPPPPAGTAGQSTYEVVGAADRDVVVLEDLVAQFPDDGAIAGIWIGTAPPPGLGSAGLVIAPTPTFGIGQANLSTVTRPGGGGGLRAARVAAPTGPVALGGNAAFLRLLWEASITASGGFFLYYQADGAGLPADIFDADGQAVITVVVIFAATLADQLHDCMTAIAITDPIDLARSAVTVEAVAVATTAIAPADQSLADFAAAAYTDLADVAADNAGVSLATGATLTIAGGTYLVSPLGTPPGGAVAAIAAYFACDPAAIIAANPRIPAATWTAPLPADTAIRLPRLELAIGTSPGGTTLAAIAAYYGADPAAILVDNQTRTGLYATALALAGGPFTQASTLPIGSQALSLARPVAATGSDPQALMLRQFSLLGYQITGNQDFTASYLGVPVGPTGGGGVGIGKARVPNRLGVGDTWTYDVTLGYQDVIAAKVGANPYQAVGRLLQLELRWLDLFGNTILSDLTGPGLGGGGLVNQQPLLVGYTDALLAVGQWPSVTATWQIAGSPGAPALALTFGFDPTRYTSADGAANATTDLSVYRTLAAQLADPAGVGFTAASSLVAAPLPIAATPMLTWIAAVIGFLTQIATGSTPPPPPPLALALPLAPLVDDPIVELSAAVTLTRLGGIVEGAVATVPGLRAATTALTPTGAATATGLASFAASFEAALLGPDALYKVAYGPDRFDGGAATSATLWAVRIGRTDGQALRYVVDDAGAPAIFAPAPISTALVSSGADLYPYVSGHGIDYGKPTPHQFAAIDLDTWVRATFAIVDGLLAPGYLSPLLLLDHLTGGTAVADLLAHKAALAKAYAPQMIAVFATDGPAPDPTAIQTAFYQTLLAQLGNAYQVQAGLGYRADVVGDPDQAPPPAYDGAVVQVTAAVAGLTLSPAKLPLATATDVALTTLVSTPTQGGRPDASAWATIDLDYTPTAIEHQIGAVPGIVGYQASSWLRFVLPPPTDPGQVGSVAAALGTVDVPLVLRAYPTGPSLATPTATPSHPDASAIEAAIAWTYAGTYTLPLHYPQDTVWIELAFNVAEPTARLAGALDHGFPALAELVTVFPQVAVDLDGALATIALDAKPPQIAIAQAAIGAVNQMLGKLTDPSAGLRAPPRPARAFSSTDDTFAFSVREDAETVEGQDGVLVVTVVATRGPPPQIAIDGYTRGDLTTTPPPLGTARYVYRDATQVLLPAAIGQAIGPRTVIYADLSILERQDATATAHVTRNDHLSPDPAVQTSPRFVYRTPDVALVRPIVPSLSSTQPIDVATIGSPDHTPIVRGLGDHLTALFAGLLAGAEQASLDVQLVVEYRYTVNPLQGAAALTIALPILMQPPLVVATATAAPPPSVASMIADLAGAITSWFAADPPASDDGALGFGLTVLTTLTQEPRPLITLANLTLALDDVYPPLATAAARRSAVTGSRRTADRAAGATTARRRGRWRG